MTDAITAALTAVPEEGPDPSWLPVDLSGVLADDSGVPVPTVCQRRDGLALFYVAALNAVHGVDASGKSWLAGFTIAQELRDGHGAVLVDLEESARTTVARLRQLGVTDDLIRDRFRLIRPDAPLQPDEVRAVAAAAAEVDARVVVFDSLGEALSLNGLNEDSDVDVTPFVRLRLRPLAEHGFAVVVIDHRVKNPTADPLWPSGSKRKRAAISGAMYAVEAVTPFAIGQDGRLRITCAKDRHGTYRRGEHVADLVIDTAGSLRLYEPGTGDDELPVVLAAKSAYQALEDEGRDLSQRALIESMAIRCSTDTKRAGIDLARDRGWIVEYEGPRRSRMFALPDEK